MAGSRPLRFGVLAPTSTVARLGVMPAITRTAQADIVAVASLSAVAGSLPEVPETARWHSGYEELLDDSRVEAVYVPLPNSLHREWVERAAEAGKHVLCEKPLAATAADAVAMADACARQGVVLMEAYMTPFHPRSRVWREMCGEVGGFLFGEACFTGRLSRPDDHRWSTKMGGGALLDVGIYVLAPLLEAAGVPASTVFEGPVSTTARLAGDGVDASISGLLAFGDSSGYFQCSFEAPERQVVEVVGTDGALVVERAFTPSLHDREFLLRRPDGSVKVVETPGGDPYQLMVEHFCDVVEGRCELERPPAHSIALLHLIDRLAATAAATRG